MGGLGVARLSPGPAHGGEEFGTARNYGLIALTVLAGLIGVSCKMASIGGVPLYRAIEAGAMMALGYQLSPTTSTPSRDSSHRATLLSFKAASPSTSATDSSVLSLPSHSRAVRGGASTRRGVGTRSGITAALGCLRPRYLWIYFLATAKASATRNNIIDSW